MADDSLEADDEIYLMLFDKKVLILRKVYVWKVCSKPITAELHHWCKAIQQTILQFIINPIHRCRENEIPGRLYGSTCHPKCHIVHYSTPVSSSYVVCLPPWPPKNLKACVGFHSP